MFDKYIKKLADNKEIYLNVKAIPGAPKTEARGEMADGTLKIAVAAAPEKGKANEELIRYLAKELGIAKSGIRIIGGAGERAKLIKAVC